MRNHEGRRCAPTTPIVGIFIAAFVAACIQWWDSEDFAYGKDKDRSSKRNPAPYGRIGGKPIIPNPEAEKFPGGVPRDEDGFPVITLREQYETNVTMYNEGLGPFPGPPMDFSGDWDYIPPDPEDADFDPTSPLGPPPPDAPEELMALQPPGAIVWPEKTPDEAIPEGNTKPKRKVAAAPEPVDEALPANLDDLRVPELKKLLTARGLSTAGSKLELIERLKGSR